MRSVVNEWAVRVALRPPASVAGGLCRNYLQSDVDSLPDEKVRACQPAACAAQASRLRRHCAAVTPAAAAYRVCLFRGAPGADIGGARRARARAGVDHAHVAGQSFGELLAFETTRSAILDIPADALLAELLAPPGGAEGDGGGRRRGRKRRTAALPSGAAEVSPELKAVLQRDGDARGALSEVEQAVVGRQARVRARCRGSHARARWARGTRRQPS